MRTDVLVVGAGPVGLVMAIELARYGVSVRVIDKAAERSDKSKALAIWSRSLELLERAGCSAALVDAGYQVTTMKMAANKKPITQLSLVNTETAYPYALMIPQNESERLLDEALVARGIRVERPVELTRLTTTADGVQATLRHGDGRDESVEAKWLVGCDGAHSTVRHQLGMEFSGDTLLIDWLLADVHLEGVARAPEINAVLHSSGVLAAFPVTADRYRIIADMGVVTDAQRAAPAPTLETLQAILDERFPHAVHAVNPIWLTSFRINERKVKDFRAGRVFLAGDAAHVHSPVGGQGMNTGMQDACNLAWKLALVVRGEGAEAALLDSYSAERSPVADMVLKLTGRATALATLSNPVAQSIRNYMVGLVLGLPFVQKLAAGVAAELSIAYAHSPLNGASRHGE
ncbi:MAG TPA: FAD-dependent monooxygenase, partial [Polyangia bacterium]|nr:FAD-dependent monooxygenase [Polyangia bacterium]